ncbi:MAG: hypothetical protein EBT44_04210 [Actinobacteria bacterium]|uniref:Uncharacterized protein n=1 Tax=Candidatus Fonsibacter lacus TaxID=2576439 RepID=A0A965GDN9_9PROT|nr:hypothetical protein [Candidatus Fonsibacter lacus]
MTTILFQEALDLFGPSSPDKSPLKSTLTFKPTPDSDCSVEDEFDFGRQITPFENLPTPKDWVDRFVHSAVEILNGRRSPVQLSRWCNRKVFAYLNENARARPAQIRIGRKSIGQPFDQILEVTAMLHGRERSRILVARFEGLDGRWICVELYTI